ncbi:hypothetical protein Tco_0730751 [Tanacetum coccineum]
MKIKESLNVTFDETPPSSKTSPLVDDDLDEEEAIKVTEKKNLENDIEDETLEIDEVVNIKESRNHPLENVIGNLNKRTLRSKAQNQNTKLTKDEELSPLDSQHLIGNLYLSSEAVKRNLPDYIKSTTPIGLWYPKRGPQRESVKYIADYMIMREIM